MKTLGLIGGTGYVSTLEYYRLINQRINQKLGSNHAAQLVLYSLNLGEASKKPAQIGWDNFAIELTRIARNLKQSGAEGLLLCANTLHMAAETISRNIDIPIIHIARETANVIAQDRINKVGLLGTKTTMKAQFYKDILLGHGITRLIPDDASMDFLNQAIYQELAIGLFQNETVSRIKEIAYGLKKQGAEGLVLGCTELPLVIKTGDMKLKSYDTLQIHVGAAVRFALEG